MMTVILTNYYERIFSFSQAFRSKFRYRTTDLEKKMPLQNKNGSVMFVFIGSRITGIHNTNGRILLC